MQRVVSAEQQRPSRSVPSPSTLLVDSISLFIDASPSLGFCLAQIVRIVSLFLLRGYRLPSLRFRLVVASAQPPYHHAPANSAHRYFNLITICPSTCSLFVPLVFLVSFPTSSPPPESRLTCHGRKQCASVALLSRFYTTFSSQHHGRF